jgi:biopolymer transport protein ExbD
MADFQARSTNKKSSRSNHLGLRIDLTPMVDLGFLLITFFIYTTTMSKDSNLFLNYADSKSVAEAKPVKEASVMHFILGKQNKVFCYNGQQTDGMHKIINDSALYNCLQQHQTQVHTMQAQGKLGMADSSIVIIKPSNDCVVQNIATIIDALTMLKITNYCIMDASVDELEKTKKL